jgi:hypothetical protein
MGPLILDVCPGQRVFSLPYCGSCWTVYCGLKEDQQGYEEENKPSFSWLTELHELR